MAVRLVGLGHVALGIVGLGHVALGIVRLGHVALGLVLSCGSRSCWLRPFGSRFSYNGSSASMRKNNVLAGFF